MEKVALVRFEGSIKLALQKGLEYLEGIGTLDGPILIKPNICTMSDGTGHSVTDIEVIEAIVDIILEGHPDTPVRFVESDSQSKNSMESFKKFGYLDLKARKNEEGFDLDVVDLSAEPLVSVEVDGLYFDTVKLHRILTEPHHLISVAVAKTHETTFLTGTLKNQFGLLPTKGKAAYHSDINKVIVDLNRMVPPHLCMADARVGVEGWNGPKTRRIGVFILGKNPVAVDATMLKIMGLDTSRAKHLILAEENNLGTLTPQVIGESIESVRVAFNAPF